MGGIVTDAKPPALTESATGCVEVENPPRQIVERGMKGETKTA
jgi:hypothetical protein